MKQHAPQLASLVVYDLILDSTGPPWYAGIVRNSRSQLVDWEARQAVWAAQAAEGRKVRICFVYLSVVTRLLTFTVYLSLF